MRSRFESVVTLPDRGARGRRAALLLQGDRRGQPVDRVHLGHGQLVEQPAGVRGDRLEVPALGLGVEGAEREATTCPSPTPR